jgi:hypothetical protein
VAELQHDLLVERALERRNELVHLAEVYDPSAFYLGNGRGHGPEDTTIVPMLSPPPNV